MKRYKYTKEGMVEDKEGEWVRYKFLTKDIYEVPYEQMMKELKINGAKIYRGE